jgi:hypothetical protein
MISFLDDIYIKNMGFFVISYWFQCINKYMCSTILVDGEDVLGIGLKSILSAGVSNLRFDKEIFAVVRHNKSQFSTMLGWIS